MKTPNLTPINLLFFLLITNYGITVAQTSDCEENTYNEVNGLVVIEAENLDITETDWSIKTDFTGYTGTGYLSWDGKNNFNSPGNGLISTSIKINTAGTYLFRWHSKVGNGDDSTEHNDSWLRFPDADEFYAEKNGERVYPNGSGLTPNPEGASSDGWFKVFLASTTDWTWTTLTNDNNGYPIYVVFDTPGEYIMEISGRSPDHLINRITLSNDDATEPLDLNNSETSCNASLSIDSISELNKKATIIYPNPVENYLYIEKGIESELKNLTIFDFKGTEINTIKISTIDNRLDVSQLKPGLYFMRTDKNEIIKFIKQ